MYIQNSSSYWNNRYKSGGNSGTGSYGHLAQFKADILNEFFEKHQIRKVIDYGCGDGYQLSLLKMNKYVGYDVSREIIRRNRERFVEDSSKEFYEYDEYGKHLDENNKENDCALSMDVLFHLVEDEVYHKYMMRLFSTPNIKYVIIYSTNHEGYRAEHVRDRQFDIFISTHFKTWKLCRFIHNPYHAIPYPEGSISNFYIYKRVVNDRPHT